MQTHFKPAQLLDPDMAQSESILRKCVHCGFCSATCPTYLLLGDELDSPRGRIYLIKNMLEQSRPATPDVVHHIDRCLSCLACMTTCPSGVHYQHLIDHGRAYIERTYRRPWADRVLRALLARVIPYPRRLRAAIAAARLLTGVTRWLPRRAWTLGTGAGGSWRALLRLASYRAPRPDSTGRVSQGGVYKRTRVAVLKGCAQSVVTPSAQAACIRLLERAGADVVFIEGCCGALVHHLGRTAQNEALASRLMGRLEAERQGEGLDALIVTASGCGTHLKDYGHLFRNHAELTQIASWTAAVTRDITEWLAEQHPAALAGAGATERDPRVGGCAQGCVVAYHSACSMQHGQQLDAIPRRLLEQAGFVVESIPEGHLCCGSAGTYNILQPQLAERLRDRKLENIRRTRARIVATGNVGCLVQLAGAQDVQVVHTAELLDWAAGGPVPFNVGARTESCPGER